MIIDVSLQAHPPLTQTVPDHWGGVGVRATNPVAGAVYATYCLYDVVGAVGGHRLLSLGVRH